MASENPALTIYSKFTPRHIFYTSIKHWYVFVVIISVVLAVKFYILRYSPRIYQTQSSIYLKGDKKMPAGSENFIMGMSMLNSSKSIQNEMEVLNAYKLIQQTVRTLNLEVSYFVFGKIKEGELYKSSPITVQLDSTFNNTQGIPFVLEIENNTEYKIYKRVESSQIVNRFLPAKIYDNDFVVSGKFGELCQSPYFRLKIFKSPNLTENYKGDTRFYFIINNLDNITWSYMSNLQLALTSKYSNIINLSVVGTVPEKDADFLNKLMETYILNGLIEKNEIATNTINFIDHQLLRISDSLKGTENLLQEFRMTNDMSMASNSDKAFEKLSQLQESNAELEVKVRYYRYLQGYISSERDIKDMIVPSAANINDPLLIKLVDELYGYVAEQNNLPFSARERNPAYKLLELKIKNTKTALIENINNLIQSTNIFVTDNNNRIKEVRKLLEVLPGQERDLLDIQRKFTLNDKIYNYLLEKRIEAGIAKASTVPDNRIMNSAMPMGVISPNIALITRYSNLIMIFLPLGIILFIMYIDDKVKNKETLAYLSTMPLLGVVHHYEGNEKVPVLVSPKSRLAESIRSIRINLQYILPPNKGKVIGVTSSISGEGKSFFSINLAASIASTGSTVVLIGADLRKPTLQKYLQLDNHKGLSSYLIAKNTVDEILINTEVEGLHCIVSGPIPPNPAELLGNEYMNTLIDELKKRYDYVIIDTPPIILVADNFVLSKYIHANIFIVRQNYTSIPMVKEIVGIVESKQLVHSVWVLNDLVRTGSYQYGYSYGGYGYGYNYGYDHSYGYYDEKIHIGLMRRLVKKIKKFFTPAD